MSSKAHSYITPLLSIIATLVIAGLLFIYSASSVYALETFGSAHYFVKKQLIACALGAIGSIICILLPSHWIKKLAPFIFLITMLATLATLLPGIGATINGSSRWLRLGGLAVQPSEFFKMAFVIYLATFLERRYYRLGSFKGFIPFLCITLLPCLVLLKQPDFGQAITLASTGFILYFLAGGSLTYLAISFLPGLGALIALITFKPYRLKRILTFLNPWQDPQGAGFQIIQSLIAIGSGQFSGLGIGQSKQKFFYLPMQHNDFIFSIIAEETGLVGVSLLIILYICLLISGIKLIRKLTSPFAQLVTSGFLTMIILQSLINIYVATGLAPTKGIGLPFISYGSSALISNLIFFGIIINCTLEEIQ